MAQAQDGNNGGEQGAQRRSALRKLWLDLTTPQRFLGALAVTVLGGLVVVRVTIAVDRDGSTNVVVPPRPTEDECEKKLSGDVRELQIALEVCGRSFWTETPTLFESSYRRAAGSTFVGLASELRGEVEALSVERIVREAPDFQGAPVYIVGQVKRSDLLGPSGSDLFAQPASPLREVRLVGRNPMYAVVVSTYSLDESHKGQIVAGKVFVGARGPARFIGSRSTVNAAYALGDILDPARSYPRSVPIQRQAQRLR